MNRYGLAPLLLCLAGVATADEAVQICYNYGCASQAVAEVSEARLKSLRDSLLLAVSPEQERGLLSRAMGSLYGWAGEQTPIHVDKGGNFADEGAPGSMDCIDHSQTSERFLQMLERRGMLRYHRVVGRIKRMRYFVVEHNAVEIEELSATAPRYVVDSWYVDNGRPAVVLPRESWMSGEEPNEQWE